MKIGVKGRCEEIRYFERPLIPRHKISYETYREHVQKVVAVCRAMRPFYSYAATQLAERYKMSANRLETLADVCCSLHDVGKLSMKWQESVRKWQQYKNPQKLTDAPLAHSDYEPDVDFENKKRFPKQPPHASEGAYAVAGWLSECFGNDAVAVWTAIARHHGAFTESLESFRLIDDAQKWLGETLPSSIGGIALADSPDRLTQGNFQNDLLIFSGTNSEDAGLWPLYVFLVRRLRLADQRSQKGREG